MNLKTPASLLSVDGKHLKVKSFENDDVTIFDNHNIPLPEFYSNTKQNDRYLFRNQISSA